jgi:hypothetical protein
MDGWKVDWRPANSANDQEMGNYCAVQFIKATSLSQFTFNSKIQLEKDLFFPTFSTVGLSVYCRVRLKIKAPIEIDIIQVLVAGTNYRYEFYYGRGYNYSLTTFIINLIKFIENLKIKIL